MCTSYNITFQNTKLQHLTKNCLSNVLKQINNKTNSIKEKLVQRL